MFVMLCIARREAKHYAVVEVSDLIPEMNVWSLVDQYHGDTSRGSAHSRVHRECGICLCWTSCGWGEPSSLSSSPSLSRVSFPACRCVRAWRRMLLCTLNVRLHPSKVHLNAVACQ